MPFPFLQMHFSIPDTTEVPAKSSTNQPAHTVFNIHINGIHHCGARYSQLRTFNEELQRLFPTVMAAVDSFPPKKLLSLSARETDERRVQLERYLQTVVQNRYITSSSYFKEFFLKAQQETFAGNSLNTNEKIDLTICLLNNHEIIIENLSPTDNTSRLLDACASKIQLQSDLLSYFALYLYELADNQLRIVRPLEDFESPYLSLKQLKKVRQQSCIVLKKSYWDAEFDMKVIDDRRARNLLFIQAQYEIEQSQDLYVSDIYRQLDILRESNSFKDYILLARTSKFYGHILLKDCSILYPITDAAKQKLCQCVLSIGNNEMICSVSTDDKKKSKECSFKVTRIRCWKVEWNKQDVNLTFEYLVKKDTLQWITIHTEQAALISNCLQSMVDEILAKRKGATSLAPAAAGAEPTTIERASAKVGNGLEIRTESEWKQFGNDELFDEDNNDDL